jgi:hypothetical protein
VRVRKSKIFSTTFTFACLRRGCASGKEDECVSWERLCKYPGRGVQTGWTGKISTPVKNL